MASKNPFTNRVPYQVSSPSHSTVAIPSSPGYLGRQFRKMVTLKAYWRESRNIMGLGRNLLKEADVRASFSQEPTLPVDWRDVARVTIDTLPDVALLKIFDFNDSEDEEQIEAWHTLVHVCRKWRNIVFGSPRRLNLRLYCKARTPVRKTLDVWPLLPIVVRRDGHEKWCVDPVIAALEHNDRICQLDLHDVPSPQLEIVWAAMHQPFPALTRLQLLSRDEIAPVVPASFMGGSVPRLQTLTMSWIPFPELPKLFCPPLILFTLTFGKFLILGTFHPK